MHRSTAMQIYGAFVVFQDAALDTEALVAFLCDLGAQKGWDDEQIDFHARYAVETHLSCGKAAAIDYLESLL
jgi:hypothetical protein